MLSWILPCMVFFNLIKYSKNIQNRKLNKEKYTQIIQEDHMDNKIETKKDLAHVDYESGRYQTMKEHSENVANYAAETCSLSELKILVSLIGMFHDVGKLGRENQEDFKRILQYGDDTHKHGLDHSTAGGRLIRELLKEKSVSEFISTVIYFHHGMGDCINLDRLRLDKERILSDL